MAPALPWEALELEHVRAFWRRMAARYIETRGREFGMRAAVGVVDALYSVAAWLRDEHHIPPDAARPQEYWRKRLKDETGRRWTRRVRDGVKPLSRDGARVAFQELEKIASVRHVSGRGWYGLRGIATDLAETVTADDRVKDRLGGWQDSETRKHIYRDRETERLRMEAASVRRQIRWVR